jgi:hypothetical protein
MTLKFSITFRDAGGQLITTTGTASGGGESSIVDAFREALAESFQMITEGRAEYGSPGKSCAGPYRFERVELRRAQE